MSSTVIVILPQQSTSGHLVSAAVALPEGVRSITLAGILSDTVASDPANTLSYQLLASYDGGQSFEPVLTTGWQGGVDRMGQPCPPGFSWSPGRRPSHVQVTFDLAQSLNLGATLTLS